MASFYEPQGAAPPIEPLPAARGIVDRPVARHLAGWPAWLAYNPRIPVLWPEKLDAAEATRLSEDLRSRKFKRSRHVERALRQPLVSALEEALR